MYALNGYALNKPFTPITYRICQNAHFGCLYSKLRSKGINAQRMTLCTMFNPILENVGFCTPLGIFF